MGAVETPDWSTGSSFQQQAGMARFLAKTFGASIRYETDTTDRFPKATAILGLPNGIEKRFDVYGGIERRDSNGA